MVTLSAFVISVRGIIDCSLLARQTTPELRCPIVPQKVFSLSPGCSRDVLEKSSQWRYP
jgi:hypothetical protein